MRPIPFDDDLVDAIIEMRASGAPIASNSGLIDRILSAIYTGLDEPAQTRRHDDDSADGGDAYGPAYGTGTIGPHHLAAPTCACGNPADNDYLHRSPTAGACRSLFATG